MTFSKLSTKLNLFETVINIPILTISSHVIMFQQTKATDSVFSGPLGENIIINVNGAEGVIGNAYLDSLSDWELKNQNNLQEHDHVMAFTR